jgi:hypothetical protein
MAFGGLGTLAWMQGRRSLETPDPDRLDSYRKNPIAIPSPWATRDRSTINQIAYADIFGAYAPQITRSQAMSIPGVARARGILLSLIADKPLVAYRSGDRLEVQPTWTYRTSGWAGPWRRMAETLDDHLFYGVSLWATTRGSVGSGLHPILDAQHVPWDEWEVDEAGRICVLDADGYYVPADEADVILIPGASEGLIAYASRTLLGAVELERAWVKRAKNPIPAIDLHETIQSGIDPDEAQTVVDAWAAARDAEDGSIAYTPFAIEARALGQYSPDFFTQGRNGSRLDIAAFCQIPGSLLDASVATASLTYVTQEGQASSLDTLTVPYWARPIEDRLSQDDVVPIGQTVRFAWAQAYTEPQGPIITSSSGHPAVQDAAQIVGEALGDEVVDAVTPIASSEGNTA